MRNIKETLCIYIEGVSQFNYDFSLVCSIDTHTYICVCVCQALTHYIYFIINNNFFRTTTK